MKMNLEQCLRDLQSLGYVFLCSGRLNGEKHFKTPEGEKVVWVYQRSFRDDGRYPIGIAPLAMAHSDEIVLWAQDETHVFIIPSSSLCKHWEKTGKRTSARGQFYFNLQWNRYLIENPRLEIARYARDLKKKPKTDGSRH